MRIGDQVRQHNCYKFHLHIYRKRWFTKAINVVPAYIANAMLGRMQYLDQYQAHPLSERQAFYKKIAKHVGLFGSQADKAQVLAEASKIAGVELSEDKLNAIKSLLGHFATMPIEDIDKLKALLGSDRE